MVNLHLDAPELHDVLAVVVREVRLCRQRVVLIGLEVLLQVLVSEDLGARFDELPGVPGVIRMMVRDDHELHRLIGDRPDLRDEVVVVLIARQLGVHEDHAGVGHADERIRAGARDHIKARLDLLDRLDALGGSASTPSRALRRRKMPRRT